MEKSVRWGVLVSSSGGGGGGGESGMEPGIAYRSFRRSLSLQFLELRLGSRRSG